jgi:acyl-CoA thioesterase I
MKIQRLVLLVAACAGLVFTAQGQTRILPLGDSVTSSFSPQNSYRCWLWRLLERNGYNADFVGTQWGVAGGPPAYDGFDMHHEGHPGWTSSDVLFNIEWIASATVPDVVLLDIGANDVIEGIPSGQTCTNIVWIIRNLREVNPDVVILLAQTTPYAGQNKQGMSRLREAVKRAATLAKREGARVASVNLAASFNVRKDTIDGIHPNITGERKIANRYYPVLKKYVQR